MWQRGPHIAQTRSDGTSKRAWLHEAWAVHEFDAYVPPAPPACPVQAVSVDVGLGKTRTWRERVAPALVGGGLPGILAVPRHRLGDEIVRDLAAAGIRVRVYRGREAADPEQPGEKMCRALERATLISDALGGVSRRACKHKESVCEFYDVCGYQRQRRALPDIWVVAHQLLFQARPSFIPEPASLVTDEAFWSGALHGVDRPVKLWVTEIRETREIRKPDGGRYTGSTADLMTISDRLCSVLDVEEEGRIRKDTLTKAHLTAADFREARRLEWRRKIEIEVEPTTPLAVVRARGSKIVAHNQLVARLARVWDLLERTIEAPYERSPWLELRKSEPLPGGKGNAPAIRMTWCDEIHESWRAPTLIMDATLPAPIVRQFFPKMPEPLAVAAPMPHTRVRQITDRAMTAEMLIPTEGAGERTNATQRANVERVRRFVEVRADDVRAGKVLVVCQLGLEVALTAGEVPDNVEIQHFNNITGENAWSDVGLVIVIGRTEPAPQTVERTARTLFGADVIEIDPDERGAIKYPLVTRGIRMRDGRGIAVQAPKHPDERAEAVRWAICEAGLVQAIGRGRGVNRGAADVLQIDILTNVVLPIEVDEVTTWNRIQPSLAQIMRARGAVPIGYADMAMAYPDLFSSADAARKALSRENPGQMPIEEYLIGVCPGFLSISYRRSGSRGPAGRLFYAARINPLAWLTDRIGDVAVVL
jgi:putative DNA primase/helicase